MFSLNFLSSRQLLRTSFLLMGLLLPLGVAGCATMEHVWDSLTMRDRIRQKDDLRPEPYANLDNQRVAMIIHSPETLHIPSQLAQLQRLIARDLGQSVEGVELVDPEFVHAYVRNHPHWIATPPSQLLRTFEADRLLLIQVEEFQIRPPGNAYQLQGRAVANIRVLEAADEGFRGDPDRYAYTQQLISRFPRGEPVPATDPGAAERLETGLLMDISRRISSCFEVSVQD